MNVILTIDAGLQHIVETELAEAMAAQLHEDLEH